MEANGSIRSVVRKGDFSTAWPLIAACSYIPSSVYTPAFAYRQLQEEMLTTPLINTHNILECAVNPLLDINILPINSKLGGKS